MMKNYKLSTSTWDDKEINAIQKVIDTGFYSMGEYVQQFESMFSKYIGAKYTVMVNSGSSANLLGIASLFFTKNNKLKRGDEVIVPAVSWSTTYSPLQQYGLKLKFVDIDINTLNYNLEELESAITDKTRLILAVNLLGNSNDFERIYKIINNRDIILFEDNCESLGAEFKNKKAGTFGKLGTFSSFFSHHISTMEGGMIVTDDEEIYNILLSIRAHGWTRNLPDKNIIHKKSKNDFNEKFKFILPGYNVRPLEMSGAIGIEQLKKLPDFISNRIRNAEYFMNKFSNNEDFILQREIGKSSWFGFSLIIKNNSKFERTKLLNRLNRAQIETRPIVTGNFVNNPTISYYEYEIHKLLYNADFLDTNGFFVGNHHYSMKDEINYLYNVIYNI
jgi:CDP-4-dehydro-6-deoxyglucose reductase, E1